jgi:hypothetical protein
MKDFHFYAEMPEGRTSKRATKAFPVPFTRDGIRRAIKAGNRFNVTAAFVGPEYRFSRGMRECISGMFDRDNSPVATTSCSIEWLDEKCVRIDEATARLSHPALFAYLDD